MDHIIPEFGEADIIVFATPIYNGNIIHYLQRMTERFLPTALPWQVEDGETTRHPERHQRKPQKGILIASAGFPDYQAFNIAKELYPKFLHITLPAAQLITDPETSIYIKDFTDAVQEAAKLLVQRENISPKLVRRLNVQYNSEMKQIIRDQANTYFKANLED
jgi:hypothetical protein